MAGVTGDQEPAGELIPKICRPLYEALIDEGDLAVDAVDAQMRPVAELLADRGLALTTPPSPVVLAAVLPHAAFERALIRWLEVTTRIRREVAEAYDHAVSLQRRLLRRLSEATSTSCYVVVQKKQVMALHKSLAHAAERQICSWETGPYGEPPSGEPPVTITGYDRRFIGFFPADARLISRGGIAQNIYDSSMIEHLPEAVGNAYADGEDVRIAAKKLPMKLLIVDDQTALVPLGPYGHPALFIRIKPLVALFQRFFDLTWDAATPYEPDAKKRKAANHGRAKEKMLKLMADGLKDEAIARQCGISVKTVRRHIAHLMDEVGARNRFAAGVAAVRRGWID